MTSIDLNSDLGEGFGPWDMGDDATMLSIVTSANVACGGHAGDPETMFQTLQMARKQSVTVGAHPGFEVSCGGVILHCDSGAISLAITGGAFLVDHNGTLGAS